MLGRHLHDTQNVYINGERLRGVQSCDAGWQAPETYVNAIGRDGGFLGGVVEESLQSTFDVQRLMVSPSDPLPGLFASTKILGEVYYNNGRNFEFTEGMITSYSCSCSVGSIPSLDFSILAYGDSGGNIGVAPARTKEKDDTIIVASPGSIILNVDGHETNRIQSFDISINVSRDPINILGKLKPHDFVVQFPVQVDCQFTIHVDDYESKNLFDFICNPTEQDLNFLFIDCETGDAIRSFFVQKSKLVDYNQSGSINEALEATFTYKSFITNLNYIEKLLNGLSY
jgi:hypothetical protein